MSVSFALGGSLSLLVCLPFLVLLHFSLSPSLPPSSIASCKLRLISFSQTTQSSNVCRRAQRGDSKPLAQVRPPPFSSSFFFFFFFFFSPLSLVFVYLLLSLTPDPGLKAQLERIILAQQSFEKETEVASLSTHTHALSLSLSLSLCFSLSLSLSLLSLDLS